MIRTGRATGWVLAVWLAFATPAGAQGAATLRMNWVWNGGQAPFALAQARGHFEQDGWRVALLEGRGSATTVQAVASRGDTFGFADAATVMLAASKGAPVLAVATILGLQPYAVIVLDDSPIRTIRDLEGRALGTAPGDGLTQLWPAVAAASGVATERVRLVAMETSAKATALLERRVDAVLGGVDGTAVAIEARGVRVRMFRFRDAGVPVVGSVLFTHVDVIREQPRLVRAVVAASVRGWEEAVRTPDAAVAALGQLAPLTDAGILRRQLAVSLGLLFSPANAQRRVGYGPPEDWEETLRLLRRYRDLETPQPASAFYTNDFLP